MSKFCALAFGAALAVSVLASPGAFFRDGGAYAQSAACTSRCTSRCSGAGRGTAGCEARCRAQCRN